MGTCARDRCAGAASGLFQPNEKVAFRGTSAGRGRACLISVGNASKHIQERHDANCSKADPAYGKGVTDALARFAAGKLWW
ncbi:MAG: hypothetical protein CFE30_07515 [Bradyrhizobium sp. PARBB1]|nr:MAG: hypothetical protein CFE30_07515 [Bradyrhizobium sp. PARBB1]PSO29196.1 hypothetical protein C7G43_01105 [Bradyrhizobium sp. MOS004]HAQ78623.1 hypothetical protein [Bradyrhizobium sp.]HAR14321.1 hypothetical protein [Bradyrhizobium sp.]HAR24241.1 hypothetical protein [Bradyrhizobium sp.]